jgi:WD40 repeat protein
VGGALAGEAERLFERLNAAQQQIARRAFLALVRLGEGVRDTRRRAILPEMVAAGERPEEVQAVLRAFAQAGERLVTLSGAGDEVCAEVTHEALFDHWTRLRGWLAAGRDDLRFHRRLAEAAEHWNTEGRPEGLLWRPPDLDLLDTFQRRAGADMTALEVDFHRTSRAREQRRRLRKRVTVSVLVLLLIAMAWLVIIANQEREKALSRSLAAQALLLVERGQGEDAMLKAATLAVESWHRTPNPDAYSVATNLLQWFPVSRIEPDPGAGFRFGNFAFSPDSRFLVIGSMHFIRLIETANNKEIWRIEDQNAASAFFRFSADSRLLLIHVLINGPNYAYLISTESAKEVFSVRTGEFTSHITFRQRGSSYAFASMSEDGHYLALTAVDSTTQTDLITIIDAHTGREACKIAHPMNRQEGQPLGVFFSPNGELLVIRDGPSSHLFEMPSGRERTRLTVSDALEEYFIGNGRWLVIKAVKLNDNDTTFHLFDPVSGRELSSIPLGKGGGVEFSDDGRFMVTSDDNNSKVRLLVVPTGEERAHWQEKLFRAFFDGSNQWLVLVTKSGLIRLINTVSGQEKSRVKLNCEIDGVALRSETDSLVVSCENGEVYTFKTSMEKETAHFKVDGRVKSLSPDGRLIATQDKDQGVLRFNETSTGREFGRVSTSGPIGISFGYSFGGLYAIFSSDSRYMAIPSPSGSIQLVDLSQTYSPFRLEAASEGGIALSHDRRLLAFAGPDHVIRVIDITTGRQLGTLRHDEPVDVMAFSADGRFLTTQQESLLTLSEIATGHEVARLQSDSDLIPFIHEISPDGNYLVI